MKACGKADASGEIREWIQTNGRCESANPRGRHVRPGRVRVVHPRLPDPGLDREVGRPAGGALHLDRVRPAHAARPLARRPALRRAAARRRARVRLGGVPVHAVRLELEHERRDHAVLPRLGLLARARGRRRAASWRRSRAGRSSRRCSSRRSGSRTRAGGRAGGFALGFAAATLAAFSILLLAPDPFHEAHVFWTRTVGFQIGRAAPWSLWDWGQYHARGLPDLHIVQRLLQGLLLAGAVAVAFFPRRKSPLQLAAFTAVLLAGFELVVTYWLYTYIPWFYPSPRSPSSRRRCRSAGSSPSQAGLGRARSPRPARCRCT